MTRRDLLRRMDRLSDQLGISTVSASTMQAAVDLFHRAGLLRPREGNADASTPADTEQHAPLQCTTGQDVTMHIESMHPAQPGE